ncbi:MAG: SDR family NAD(P)-dependent oxidoreductase [Pseudomonadales bacterium]|nr:SDR family NAD(P)-dependent oxidoreductase [Pseudomonadales bacterium]
MLNIFITGATNGIGRATAIALAQQGHRLFLLCRNPDLAESLRSELDALSNIPVTVYIADLAEVNSIKAAVAEFLALNIPLHRLINNAGVMHTSRHVCTINGEELEQMFAVNHLGHYLLTMLLLPKLIDTGQQADQPSRLVIVASEAHALFCKGMNFDDLNAQQSFKPLREYGRSKLANLLMMMSLLPDVNPQHVLINALHPGAVQSGLGGSGQWYEPIIKGLLRPFFLTASEGAATSLYVTTADISTHGGYYVKSKLHRMKPWAEDPVAAEKLAHYSKRILGLEQTSIDTEHG